jgi:hypothetical protein
MLASREDRSCQIPMTIIGKNEMALPLKASCLEFSQRFFLLIININHTNIHIRFQSRSHISSIIASFRLLQRRIGFT